MLKSLFKETCMKNVFRCSWEILLRSGRGVKNIGGGGYHIQLVFEHTIKYTR